MLGLEKLGMRPDTLEGFNKVINRPNGIFLVTGPTGSGKTTTLYSALNELNRPDRKIITAEDPIEYNFKGINQCQVNMQMDPPLDFKLILRAMLRQAPNIILVGEIRDQEVGEVAVQAALTGHMVFSHPAHQRRPLGHHPPDRHGPQAVPRGQLDPGGAWPAAGPDPLRPLQRARGRPRSQDCMALCGMTRDDLEGKTIYKPGGCTRCGDTGFRGRRGIYEIMFMNSEIRELAFNRAPVGKIRAAAVASGMRTLLGDGKLKILDGQTTLDEIAKIAQVEGVVDVGDDEDDLAA